MCNACAVEYTAWHAAAVEILMAVAARSDGRTNQEKVSIDARKERGKSRDIAANNLH